MYSIGDVNLLDRMVSAVQKVRERLLRSTAALENAGVPYAVIGGNAVASWVGSVDVAAVRNTPNVDILINRSDFTRARTALVDVYFCPFQEKPDFLRDGPHGSDRTRLRLLFAEEKVRASDILTTPSLSCSLILGEFRCIGFNALLQMKLTAFRTVDQVHLRDLLDVELIDATWTAKYPPELAARLQLLIDTPEGHFG